MLLTNTQNYSSQMNKFSTGIYCLSMTTCEKCGSSSEPDDNSVIHTKTNQLKVVLSRFNAINYLANL